MLPPTIIEAPTSEITLPKPAIRAARSGKRASRHSAITICMREAPRPNSCSRRRGSSCCKADAVRPGDDRGGDDRLGDDDGDGGVDQAQVAQRSAAPQGMETTRPTTTGGNAMPVLIRLRTKSPSRAVG